MRSILSLSILLYPLLASSRGIFRPIEDRPTIHHGIEAWPDTLPTITCETTYSSPRALDVFGIIYDLDRHSHVIRIGHVGDTRAGKAWTVAGRNRGAAVGVYAGYGVGVLAVTPIRAVKMLLYKCRKRIGGVERVGGRADFVTGMVVDAYRVR